MKTTGIQSAMDNSPLQEQEARGLGDGERVEISLVTTNYGNLIGHDARMLT